MERLAVSTSRRLIIIKPIETLHIDGREMKPQEDVAGGARCCVGRQPRPARTIVMNSSLSQNGAFKRGESDMIPKERSPPSGAF